MNRLMEWNRQSMRSSAFYVRWQKGISIVISSHHLAELDHLVDTIALLHRGQMLAHGTTDALQAALALSR